MIDEQDGKPYYAQIMGFIQDQYCEKSAALTWLIPTLASPRDQFDPASYIIGEAQHLRFTSFFSALWMNVPVCVSCQRAKCQRLGAWAIDCSQGRKSDLGAVTMAMCEGLLPGLQMAGFLLCLPWSFFLCVHTEREYSIVSYKDTSLTI